MRYTSSKCALFVLWLAACGTPIDPRSVDPKVDFGCDNPATAFEAIVKPSCATSGCHSAPQAASDLDFSSPEVARRVLSTSSRHCKDQVLLNDDAIGGFIFDKLDDAPACGARMPLGGPALTAKERACLHSWLYREVEAVAVEKSVGKVIR